MVKKDINSEQILRTFTSCVSETLFLVNTKSLSFVHLQLKARPLFCFYEIGAGIPPVCLSRITEDWSSFDGLVSLRKIQHPDSWQIARRSETGMETSIRCHVFCSTFPTNWDMETSSASTGRWRNKQMVVHRHSGSSSSFQSGKSCPAGNVNMYESSWNTWMGQDGELHITYHSHRWQWNLSRGHMLQHS